MVQKFSPVAKNKLSLKDNNVELYVKQKRNYVIKGDVFHVEGPVNAESKTTFLVCRNLYGSRGARNILKLMFLEDISRMPLHIGGSVVSFRQIAAWRLRLGK